MKNFLAQIQKEVPLVIFDVPRIKEKSMKLFDENEKQIKERFNEIVTYLNMNDQISYKDVLLCFKLYFYQSILNDAVEIIFAPNYKYDILDIIVCSLLTKEKLLSAISGRTIIDAFSKVLSEL